MFSQSHKNLSITLLICLVLLTILSRTMLEQNTNQLIGSGLIKSSYYKIKRSEAWLCLYYGCFALLCLYYGARQKFLIFKKSTYGMSKF